MVPLTAQEQHEQREVERKRLELAAEMAEMRRVIAIKELEAAGKAVPQV